MDPIEEADGDGADDRDLGEQLLPEGIARWRRDVTANRGRGQHRGRKKIEDKVKGKIKRKDKTLTSWSH